VVLAVVDGDVGFAADAVGGQPGFRHHLQNMRGHRLHALPMHRSGGGIELVVLVHLAFYALQSGGAVFGHDGIHRPRACKGQAPANRSTGDGHDGQARRAKIVQGLQRIRGDGTVRGQGVVDVCEDTFQLLAGSPWPVGQRLQALAGRHGLQAQAADCSESPACSRSG